MKKKATDTWKKDKYDLQHALWVLEKLAEVHHSVKNDILNKLGLTDEEHDAAVRAVQEAYERA